MTANELRIGNYINENGKVVNVGHIQNNFYGVLINGNGLDKGMYTPIPLRNEWLIKLGFSKLAGMYTFYTDPCEFVFNFDHISVVVEGQWMSLNHVIYVHQLQNLYFALTGKELEVVNG